MKNAIRILALVLALSLLMAGCGSSTKTYTCGDLTMTVPSYMKDVSSQSDFSGFTFALDSSKIAVFGLNETFAEYPVLEDYDTKSYAETVISTYGLTSTAAQRSGSNYYYFVYTAETEAGEFTYMAGVYRNAKGFWMVQICAPTAKYDEQAFFSYLDSVNIG